MAEDQILTDAQIAEVLQQLPGWELRDGWLRRKYRTPGWTHTLMLVNTVGFVAEAGNHHPDLEVGYAQLIVKIQTHRVRAITWSDVDLARKIEEVVAWKPDASSPLQPPAKWFS